MAGHSQFKNIMHRKGAQDIRRAKMFTKIGREITVAARTGLPDPASNPRLRAALAWARSANMPRDNIERLIKRATGEGDTADYTEIRYEGYGPGGVAIIVETLTDNRNRTAGDIRSTFSRFGGSLGETNSVSFMFNRVGEIAYATGAGTTDAVFEAALEAGAEDVTSDASGHIVTTTIDGFAVVRDALAETLGEPRSASLVWRPLSTVAVPEEAAASLLKLLDMLEDNDDVQRVAANFEIADDVIERLAAA